MKIITKERNCSDPRDKCLFYFEFMDSDEAEAFFTTLRYCASQLPEPTSGKLLTNLAAKLERRYENRVTFLCPAEMASFAKNLIECMWIYEDFTKMLDDLVDQLDDDEEDNTLMDSEND